MTSIDTLFLDAGSVLVHPNWWRISDALGAHGLAVSPAALRDADPHVRFAIDTEATVAETNDADRGSLFLHGVLDRAGVPRGVARDAALTELYAYHLTHNLWDHVPDDVQPALERLKGMGLRLVVASNANGVLARMFERVGLSAYFHTIGDSHVEGVEKPDPRFFEILLARCGGRPEATVHVGDLYHVDVAGARRAGIAALLFDPLGLYGGVDVERVGRLGDLPERLAPRVAGRVGGRPVRDGVAGEVVTSDERWMGEAIEQARIGLAAGEVPVGAVLVVDGRAVAHTYNQPIGACDPTAHAEVLAVRAGARVVGNYRLTGATLYVTIEPCLMCVGALVHARVATVVYGAAEPKAGALESSLRAHEAPGLNHRLAVRRGVREGECRALIQQFFRERREAQRDGSLAGDEPRDV